ncbi:MAG: serine hydrolase domain-containing protein [Acidobacteriota bacterium]|nr:serine hydrolase domain-containing protein [Acidobacteriota bacterium]
MSPRDDPLRAWVESRIAAGVMPGAVWQVREEGRVLSRGAAGLAARFPEVIPTSESTPYDLASLTKPLATALVAVLLEQEGVLDLDRPAETWIDELHGSAYETVSCVELGAHRAGLPDWRPLYLEVSSLEGYLYRIAAENPVVPRGEERYSDLGYILLGAALERAAGQSLDSLFRERVAEPLDITARFVRGSDRVTGAAATEVGNLYEQSIAGEEGTGYAWRTRPIRGEVHDGNAFALGGVAGHAGLFGTAEDVATIACEILTPGLLSLGPEAHRRLLAPVGDRGERTFGFVLARGSDAARDVLPETAPGHAGFTGTSLWLDPDRGRAYIYLTNRVHPEVVETDFQAERREFHRLAAAL